MTITRLLTWGRRLALGAALCGAPAAWAQDPPERVARLAEIDGPVSIVPADSESWDEAVPNRPVVPGDRIETGPGGRAMLEFDTGVAYLGSDTTAQWTGLDDGATRLDVPAGTLRLDAEAADGGAAVEVRTPTLSFVVDTPGSFRFDVDPAAGETVVTVFEGAGSVYADGREHLLRAAQAYRFSAEGGYTGLPLPPLDAFDRWALDRRDLRNFAGADRYVPDGVVGYRDLDRYGDWEEENDYGPVWYPRVVHTTWAPYRDGYWSWVAPWGWTWVDAAPWGFAPFHYGRWVHVHRRWGWVPGPRHRRACYAPALVGFTRPAHHHHRAHAPVGWFPLGPRDVYRPGYAASDEHYYRINEAGSRWHHRNALRQARHRQDGPDAYAHAGHPDAYTQADGRDFARGAGLRARTRPGDRNLLGNLSIAPDPGIPRPTRARQARRGTPGDAGHAAWRDAGASTRAWPASRLDDPARRSLRVDRVDRPGAQDDAAPAAGALRAEPRRWTGRDTPRRAGFESPRPASGSPSGDATPTPRAEPRVASPAGIGRDGADGTTRAWRAPRQERNRAPAALAPSRLPQAHDAPARAREPSAQRHRTGRDDLPTLQRNPPAQPPATWTRPERPRTELRTPDRPTRQSLAPSRPARAQSAPQRHDRMERSGLTPRAPALSAPADRGGGLRGNGAPSPPRAAPDRPARMDGARAPRASREMRAPRGEWRGLPSRGLAPGGGARDGGRANGRGQP